MIQHGIIFRLDAGPVEGLGHLKRCLVLASTLRAKGCSVWFICRTRRITTDELLKNYKVYYLDDLKIIDVSNKTESWDARSTLSIIKKKGITPTLIVLDHYDLGVVWERILRETGFGIVVIDDFRVRQHCADLITSDSNAPFALSMNSGLTDSKMLIGPPYALLSSDYAAVEVRKVKKIKRILVTYGAADPTGETLKAMKAIDQLLSHGLLSKSVKVDVVIGPLNTLAASLSQTAEIYGQNPHHAPSNLVSLMSASDLVVTAGGNTMTEALALLKPCVVTITAENQLQMVHQLSLIGLINSIGVANTVSVSALAEAIEETAHSIEQWATRIATARLYDYYGAERICQEILELCIRNSNKQTSIGLL